MKRKILIAISFFFIIVSCGDNIFDRKPLDKLSEADVWNEPELVRFYLNDVYQRMYYNNKLAALGPDTKTDIATTFNGNNNVITQGTVTRSSDPLPYWDYSVIRDANIILEKAGDLPFTQVEKNQIEGEARVLRCMAYYEMQIRYGGVPLVDITLDPFNPIDKKYTQRSNEEAIADFIDADLNTAIGLLTEDVRPLGKINKWTAYALKARANLWAASIAKYGNVQLNGLVGIPSGRANEFFTKASAAANAVILSGKYSLFNAFDDKSENYRQLFITPNNDEAIFSMMTDGANIWVQWNELNLPQSEAGGWGARDNPSWDYMLKLENIDGSPDQPLTGPEHLYDDMWHFFSNKDPRLAGSVFFDEKVYEGITFRTYEGIDPSPTPDPTQILSNYGQTYQGMPQVAEDSRLVGLEQKQTQTGFCVLKFCKGLSRIPNDVSWMEYRLAEMYLIRAEAEFEVGNMQNAATALNATRERAGISLVDASTITLDHVRTERMAELFFEQHRWWDLRRWRIAEDVLNQLELQGLRIIFHYETQKLYFIPRHAEQFVRSFLPRMYYNPITDSRIDNNSDLVENPGY